MLFEGYNYDRYSGKRPIDYPLTKWESELPNITFIVPSIDELNNNELELSGSINLVGETKEITVWFPNTNLVVIKEISEDLYLNSWLEGSCNFSPENLIVTISKDNDTLFNGQYETITFVRSDLE
ncbi:MAG: hypothetical protein PHT83_05920 [Bacilli bacterium]|nr:hypothetical protein [Bacilli bacterium]